MTTLSLFPDLFRRLRKCLPLLLVYSFGSNSIASTWRTNATLALLISLGLLQSLDPHWLLPIQLSHWALPRHRHLLLRIQSDTSMGATTGNMVIEGAAPTSYSDPAVPIDPPFPTPASSWTPPQPTGYYTQRTVHQVHFKIFSDYDNREELWVTEQDHHGLVRTKEPETYFFYLTGDDSYARHTSDYWRAFFQVPTRHVEHPFHYGNTALTASLPTNTAGSLSTATLATELRNRIFNTANDANDLTVLSAELNHRLSFAELQALARAFQTLAASSSTETTEGAPLP